MRLWRGQVNHRNKIYKKTCVQYEAEQLPPFVVGTRWLSLDLGGFIRCWQIAILALAGVFWYMIRSYHLVICFSSLFMLLLTLFWPFSLLHHPQISQNVECLFMPSRLPAKKKIQQEHPQWPSCSEIGIEVASLHVGFQLFHHLQRLGWSKMTNKHWIPGVIFSKGIRVSEQRHTCEKTWKIPCKLHQF